VLGLLERLDKRHVHGIKPIVTRTWSRFGYGAPEFMTDNLFGQDRWRR
jgi:hypothetical protein